MPKLKKLLIVIFSFILLAPMAMATTWNIPVDFANLATAIASVNVVNGDVIELNDGVYVIGNQTINKSLTIKSTSGVSTNVIISGSGTSGIFSIDAGLSVTFSALTIQNGSRNTGTGAGINLGNNSALDLVSVRAINNVNTNGNGGFLSTGTGTTVNIYTSLVSGNAASGNGPGIEINGVARVENTLFTNNRSTGGNNGGAIWLAGSRLIDVLNSSFVSNNAWSGGALFINNASTANLRNNIFFNNSATGGSNNGGALFITGGFAYDYNSNYLNNRSTGMGGAVHLQGGSALYTAYNNIYYNNAASTGTQLNRSGGTVSINYSNAVSDNAGFVGYTFTSGILNTTSNPTFTNYSGGDYSLALGSPLINTGFNGVVDTTTDILGNTRIQSTTVDVGAFEFNAPTIVYVSVTGNNANDGSLANPFATIQYAYDSVAVSGTVYLLPGTHTINTTVELSKSLTIAGYGTSLNTIVTTNATRHFTVTNNNSNDLSVTFNNFTLTGGFSTGILEGGPAIKILNDSVQLTVNIVNMIVSGNIAGGNADGGAIFIEGSQVNPSTNIIVRNSLFINNRARNGGAIFNGRWSIYDSQFIGNRATGTLGNGLGGFCKTASLTLENTVVANHFAQSNLALFDGCRITANNSVFYSNTTNGVAIGGGSFGAHMAVNHSVFYEPTHLTPPSIVKINNSFFYNNTSSSVADVSGNYHYEQRFIQLANTPNYNFSLSGASHLIDLGIASISVPKDAFGVTRPVYLRQDMGAFEFQGLTVINMEPILYQTAVPVSTNITFNVVSALSQVITSSITATVNGVNVANGSFTFVSTVNGVQAVYDSPTDYPGLTEIPMTINAQDTSGNSVQKMYVFTTGVAPAAGPIAYNLTQVTSYNTIAGAVASANPGDEIAITLGIHYLTQQVTIDKSLIIRGYTEVGGTSANVIIDGTNLTRIFLVTENNNVTISHLTIQNGYINGVDNFNGDTSWGGGIFFKGSQLNLQNVRGLGNNNDNGVGGFLAVTNNVVVNIEGSYFYNNRVGTPNNGEDGIGGGAIFVGLVSLNIQNSQFVSNSVLGTSPMGGALFVGGGTANIYNNEFVSNNSSAIAGAAFFGSGQNDVLASVIFENNLVSGNRAILGGGLSFGSAAPNDGAPSLSARILNNIFSYNTATSSHAGAVWLQKPRVEFSGNLFNNNSAGGFSGALAAMNSNVTMNNNIFVSNNAQTFGGGFGAQGSTINAQFNTYYGNNAVSAGGAFFADISSVVILNDIYYGNTSPASPQLGFSSSTVTINYSLVPTGNSDVTGYIFEGQPGNVTGDPVFLNAPAGNLQLSVLSPLAVREGATTNVVTTIDYLGVTRTDPYSMGAYEYFEPTPIAFIHKGGVTYNYYTIIEAVEAASANDTVLITPNVSPYIEVGTITINVSLNITSITGVSTDVKISGGDLHRVFLITDNATVSMSYLTIQNGFVSGDVGAGINLINGNLYINDVIASYNRALNGNNSFGGFLSASTLGNASINNSLFVRNTGFVGGAIFGIGGNVSILNSEFIENFATYGGGAACFTWTIADPTNVIFSNNIVSGNGAGSYGGGLFLGKDTGSGDYSEFQATINNNIFKNNTAVAAGAVIGYFGTKTVLNNIFYSNNATGAFGGALVLVNRATTQFNTYYGNTSATEGGAVYAGNEVVMQNEVFSNNNAVTGNQIRVFGSAITINYSIVPTGDVNDVNGYSFTTQPGNITGNPLFVNAVGGDFHLQAGSPAIGSATDNVLVTTDYTGTSRSLPYDMGAFEFVSSSPNIAFNIKDGNGPTISYTTIIAAVEAASPNDTILVTPGVWVEEGTITVSVSLNISSISGVSTNTAISGGGAHRIFIVTNNAVVTISAMTLQNGFMDNGTDYDAGGGILLRQGSVLTLDSIRGLNNVSVRTANPSNAFAGFLMGLAGSTVNITDSYFSNNFVDGTAGVLLTLGYADITNSIFSSNEASVNVLLNNDGGWGGAVVAMAGLNFTGNIVSGNRAYHVGGGLIVAGGYADVQNNLFIANSASNFGGGFVQGGTHTNLINNIFYTNSATTGGALITMAGELHNEFNTIAYNSAFSVGGALYVIENTTANILNDIYYGNQALTGSQIYIEPAAVVSLTYSNIASGNAGVVGFDFEAATGNVTGDPLFVSVAGGDFHLTAGSAAADSATDNVLVTTDYTGATRTLPYDMGAFDFVPPPSLDVYLSPTGSDLTGDGSVGNPYETVAKGVEQVTSNGFIYLFPGVFTMNAQVVVTKSFTMQAYAGGGATSLNAIVTTNGTVRHFNFNTAGVQVTFNQITLGGGRGAGNGGSILIGAVAVTLNFNHSIIANNGNGSQTGGFLFAGSGAPRINAYRSQFINNRANTGGVAIFGTWYIDSSIISGNIAVGGQGGYAYGSIGNHTIINSIIAYNNADLGGGVGAYGTYLLHNNTIYENNAANGPVGFAGSWTLVNNILNHNGVSFTATQNFANTATGTISYSMSDIGNSPLINNGNNVTENNPLFESVINQDFRLTNLSAAINAGTNNVIVTSDYDGVARPKFSSFDMGAFEFHYIRTVMTSPTHNQTNVPLSASINLFVEDSDYDVSPNTVRLYLNNIEVTAVVSASGQIMEVSYDPPGDLLGNTVYAVSLNVGDVAGNLVTHSFSFTTQPAPPLLTVVYLSPTGNDTTGDGSDGNPYQTVEYGFSRVTPDGIIYLYPGVFTMNAEVLVNKSFTLQSYTAGGATSVNAIVSTNGTTRHFNFNTENIFVTFNAITMMGGATINNNGGSVYISASAVTINIIDSNMVSNNAIYPGSGPHVAGGFLYSVSNQPFINVMRSRLSFNSATFGSGSGGGMASGGTWLINFSKIEGNRSTAAGGVSDRGFFTIRNSIIKNNISNSTAGVGSSGAFGSSVSTWVLENTTLVKNIGILGSFSAGIGGNRSTWTMVNCILSGNTGSSVTKNFATSGLVLPTGTISYSIVSQFGNVTNAGNNITSDPDPLFANASLDDYSLLVGSPAIDTGTSNVLVTTDILNVARPQGSAYDMGAFEYIPVLSSPNIVYVSVTGNNFNDGSAVSPFATIEHAFDVVAVEGTIYLYPGVFTINAQVTVNKSFTMSASANIGSTSLNAIVTTNGTIRHFYIPSDNVIVTFNEITLGGGNSNSNGGSILITASTVTLNLNSVRAIENSANLGGFIYETNNTARINVSDSLIDNNRSTLDGGVGYQGVWQINRSTFSNNLASNYGGVGFSGTWTVNNSFFQGNYSSAFGGTNGTIANGGIWNIKNSVLDTQGIAAYQSDWTLENVTLINSLRTDGSNLNVINSVFGTGLYTTSAGSISYSLIPAGSNYGSLTDNGGNINANPLFVDESNGNYRLSFLSPAINTGTNNVSVTTDIENTPRPKFASYDMGAYEYHYLLTTPLIPTANQANVPTTSILSIQLNDSDFNIVTTSIQVYLDGALINPVITDAGTSVNLTYVPPVNLEYNKVYVVTVNATDGVDTVTHVYSFTTEEQPSVINLTTLITYGSVQAALNAASAGDILEIFVSNPVVGSVAWPNIDNLTLRGLSSIPTPTMQGSSDAPVIAVLEGVSLSIRNIIITGGTNTAGGGGLGIAHSSAIVHLKDLYVSGNTALNGGGLFVSAVQQLLIEDSYFINNHANATSGLGGGIYFNSTTTGEIYRSVIRDNDASGAGGILAIGASVTIAATLVDHNTAFGYSGVLDGGGMAFLLSQFYLENVTIADNTAGLGLAYGIVVGDNSHLDLVNGILNNGGTNEIVESFFGFGSIAGTASVNYSNIAGASGSEPWWHSTNTTSDPLFVNPSVNDYRIQNGSSAENTGTNNVFYTGLDLAGNTRPMGGLFDMGAYEFVVPIAFNQTQGMAPYATIASAVAAANPGDTIVVTPGTHLITAEIPIAISINISSVTGVSTDVVLDAGNNNRIFNITDSSVSISSITFIRGLGTPGGSIILNSGSASIYLNDIRAVSSNSGSPGGFLRAGTGTMVTVENSYFSGNTSAGDGGVFSADTALLNVSGNIFMNNISLSSFGGGGALSNFGGTINITANYFQDNITSGNGGAIFGFGAVNSYRNTFINNIAQSTAQGGGAMGVAFVNDYHSYYEGNHANKFGGAIGSFVPPQINGSIFKNNTASENGGAIMSPGLQNISANIVNTLFIDNTADQYGGAIYYAGNAPTINNYFYQNIFYNNTAGLSGGAIFVGLNADLFGNNNIFQNNNALEGNHLAVDSLSLVDLTYSIMTSGNLGVTGNFDFDAGLGNITQSAMFVNPGADNFHQLPGSLGIDSGTINIVTLDFNGDTRPSGSAFDMGIFEEPYVVQIPSWNVAIATANGINTHDGRVTLSWGANGNIAGTIYEILWVNASPSSTIIYSGTTLNFLHNPLPDRTTQSYQVRAAFGGTSSNYTAQLDVFIPDATFDIPTSNPSTSQNFTAVPSNNNYETNQATIYYYEQTTTKAAVFIDGNDLEINLNEIDFSEIIVTQDAYGSVIFEVPSTSEFGMLVNDYADNGNTKNIPIRFENLFLTQGAPLITLDLGAGPFTINQYGVTADKSTIPDNYKGRITELSYDANLGVLSFTVNRFSAYGIGLITTINIIPESVTMNPSTTQQITVQVLDNTLTPNVEGAPVTISATIGSFIGAVTGFTDASGNITFVYQSDTSTGNVTFNVEAGGVPEIYQVLVEPLSSNIVTQSLTLEIGYNLIALMVSENFTAENFLIHLNSLGASVDRLLNYQNGGYQSHLLGLPFNNFNVIPVVKGYFVYSNTVATIEITGNAIVGNHQIPISAGGYTIIGFPLNSYTASTLATTLNAQISGGGGDITRVLSYQTGSFQSHLIGLPFNDFTVTSGRGYFVYNDGTASTFNVTVP